MALRSSLFSGLGSRYHSLTVLAKNLFRLLRLVWVFRHFASHKPSKPVNLFTKKGAEKT